MTQLLAIPAFLLLAYLYRRFMKWLRSYNQQEKEFEAYVNAVETRVIEDYHKETYN